MAQKKVRSTNKLEAIADKIRQGFSVKDQAREQGLRLSREVIRNCSEAIRAVHRQEYPQAKELLSAARSLLAEIDEDLAGQGEILFANYIRDAQKEYAEGCITLALVAGEPLPEPEALGVSYAAYLNGMGEAAGELRRYLLDSIRRGDLSRCEELMAAMDDIYSVLVTMDFPEGVTGGLRHTTDAVRGTLERTRGDLTLTLRQQELGTRLESLEKRLGKGQ